MTEHPRDSKDQPDPLMAGVRRAAIHLGKAGFEVIAAVGALSTGIASKVRPPDPDDEASGGPEHIRVD